MPVLREGADGDAAPRTRGVALFHTRRDVERPAGPAVTSFRDRSLNLPSASPRWWTKTRSPRPACARAGRSWSLPGDGSWIYALSRRTPRPSRAGPSGTAGPARSSESNAGSCRSRTHVRPCRSPADPPRTTATYRARPVRPPVGRRSRGGWASASSCSFRSIQVRAGHESPPVRKNEKGAASHDAAGPRFSWSGAGAITSTVRRSDRAGYIGTRLPGWGV